MAAEVRKAVFPVAGLGTRFLPATKATAKEMLPVVDKPIIQYAVEEAVEAGITELVFVTARAKRAIEDHFDRSPELEGELESRGKADQLREVRDILPPGVSCLYVRQAQALGLGHAVLCARPAVGEECFAVILPDDLIHHEGAGCLAQMTEIFEREGCSLVAVESVDPDDTARWGIVDVAGSAERLSTLSGIVRNRLRPRHLRISVSWGAISSGPGSSRRSRPRRAERGASTSSPTRSRGWRAANG